MKTLYNYLNEQNVNEGLLNSGLNMLMINKLNPRDTLINLFNMYEYIADNSDMKAFWKDVPFKQIILWKQLYKLYKNKVWGIFDVNKSDVNETNNIFTQSNQLIKVTPEIRRNIRKIYQNSKVGKHEDDINPNEIDKIMLIKDPQFDQEYIFVINKLRGLKGVVKIPDIKMIEKLFEKITKNM